jgi:hypothetical protein
MSLPRSWTGVAFNAVPTSENRIHSDEVARAYGFRGGLVPGVTVSAYLLHPAAVAWGRDFIERGSAHAAVRSPVYDGEAFEVEVSEAKPDAYRARLLGGDGTPRAEAEVSLPDVAPEPPRRRHDPLFARGAARPDASREVMERLREKGLLAMPACWNERAEITSYLRDAGSMAPVFRDAGLANPAFVLGLTNWVLAGNVRMSAWLHLETWSQHYAAIAPGTEIAVEAAIADLFERKGHEFVDVDVAIFAKADDTALASVRLRAIYRLRAA